MDISGLVHVLRVGSAEDCGSDIDPDDDAAVIEEELARVVCSRGWLSFHRA